MGTVLKLTDVRLSYPRLDTPDYFQGVKSKATDKRRWSAAFHIAKSDTAQINKTMAAIEAEAKGKWGNKAAAILKGIMVDPKGCCYADGELKDAPDVMILTAHKNEDTGPPLVYDNDKSPIYDKVSREIIKGKEGRLFAGCYVDAQVEIWPQDNKMGKGIRATLLIVQRRRIGEAFSGGSAPNPDDFDEIEEGADADDVS